MAEDLNVIKGSKTEQYTSLIPQIRALIAGETNLIANLANSCAALKEQFDLLWIGFYFVEGDELVLGPFQGPVACTRIAFGKGVCGTAWREQRTLIVPDVDAFPGHIACSSASRSEIVVPVTVDGKVIAVLDADSSEPAFFDPTDQHFLEELVSFFFNSSQ